MPRCNSYWGWYSATSLQLPCHQHSVWNLHPAELSFLSTAMQPTTQAKSGRFHSARVRRSSQVCKVPMRRFAGCFGRRQQPVHVLSYAKRTARGIPPPLSQMLHLWQQLLFLCHTVGSSWHFTDNPSPPKRGSALLRIMQTFCCKFRLAETNPELPLRQL